LAIAQNRQLELAAVGQHRLRTDPIAVIAGSLLHFPIEMHVHLGVQNALRQRLLELIEQSILLKHRLGVLARQQLVQELLLEPGFSCHTTLLSSR